MKDKNNFLSKKEEIELRREHKRERNKKHADKIKAVLLLNKGWSVKKVSEALLIDESTVVNYFNKFTEGGIENLLIDYYLGAPTKLSMKQENDLKEHLKKNTYLSCKDIASYVYQKYGIIFSITGMRDLLKRLNFSYKKPKLVPAKADIIEQLDFLTFYNLLKSSLGKNDKIYFADAVHPQHNSRPTHGWFYKGENKELKTNSGRKRLNIIGAIEIDSLDSVFLDRPTIDMLSVMDLIKKVEDKNPLAKKIYLILDNASYYKNNFILDLTEGSRTELIFLPPYTPNLNLIERFWKFFKRKVTSNNFYPSFEFFKDACMSFLKKIKLHKKELKNLLTDNFEIIQTDHG